MQEKIDEIMGEIEKAAKKSGRKKEDITIVGVSKTKPAELIDEAVNLGITDIGENYVQEFCDKYPKISNTNKINFHFIGHLQRNKVKYIVDKVSLIQSVDNIALAKEIDRQSAKIGRIMDILIEVNIGGEESKSGISPDGLDKLISDISFLKNIRLCGLMAIPPLNATQDELCDYFRRMRKMFDVLRERNIPGTDIKHLSMGMSADFPLAIEAGATMVRIGTRLFGERIYI
ncbi:MAG: YggS family pyridoxal phosphate-dependent enzyme [Bacillota bacterium]|nr:YggS family pyridoxal phosphate-dependent enzyme [Bacillota bacterium]